MTSRDCALARRLLRPRGGAFSLWLPILIASGLLLAAAPLAAAEPVLKDGVPHVTNPAAPRDGVEELRLEELWRRGGEDDDEVILGLASSVLTDKDGNLYVLDAQQTEILVFAPDGRLLRTLGRRGQGPGEFENAQRITFLPGGDAIGVAQTFPGKFVGINLDGTPAGDIKLGGDPAAGGFCALIGAQTGGDNLVAAGIDIAFNQAEATMNRNHFVRSYRSDGAVGHEYHTKNVRWDFSSSFTMKETDNDYVWWRMAVDREGRVFLGIPREDYEISVYSPDGKLERVFGRAYETWPRSAKIQARFDSMVNAQLRQLPPGTNVDVAKVEQDIWGIQCQPDGTCWVTTSRGMYEPPAGVFTVWDVFDRDGVFVKQVQAKVPGKPGTDLMLVTEHGFAIMITGFWDSVLSVMGATAEDDDAESMQIVCYKIL